MDITNLYFSYGIEPIFKNVNIHISDNDHVGVVGVNGAGKSTFFHLLLKDLEPDFGTIKIPCNRKLAYLPQVLKDEIPNMDITVLEYLNTARPISLLNEELTSLYEKASLTNDEKKCQQILKKAGQISSLIDFYEPYKAEEQLIDIAIGLNIFELFDKSLKKLSGGEKSKVAFAHMLFSKPDIILLDEPTNHLDALSKDYITNYLKKYFGIVLIISHDIPFLNAVTNKTLYLDKMTHQMELFLGSYDKYQKQKKAFNLSQEKMLKKQEQEEEKLKKVIAKYIRGNEKKANIAKDRQKKLAKLQENKIVLSPKYKQTKFKMQVEKNGDFYPLKVENLTFGYNDDNLILNNLSLNVIRKERILIIGENGVGKSTFLKLLVGILKPLNGVITFGKDISVGYYAQEHELLDENKNIIEQFFDITKDISFLRGVLGQFLFFDDDIYKKISVLSPGERSRVALAKLALSKSNLLLLDEPTNHLDPETEEIIAEAFKDYPGTLLLVSHNIDFVKNLNIEKMLFLPSGKIIDYNEDIVKAYQLLAKNKNLDL